MQWGAKLLNYVDFPTSEVLGPEATSEQNKDLIDRYGMSTLELNPIRMMPKKGRLIPVACDFKCAFDTDTPPGSGWSCLPAWTPPTTPISSWR